jgi:N-acetylglucosaminyldiphosphoundecaprenol N-acetyl-beta-D-mannosaminyltransferase
MGPTGKSAAIPNTEVTGEQVDALGPSQRVPGATSAGGIRSDDLRREVYCVLGLPIDAIEMTGVVSSIEFAASRRAPFLLSTPNLNFLVRARSDPEFRDSVLLSDLCPPDGMPLIWIARLMGLPVKSRVAGSDIFDALMSRRHPGRQLKVYLFGGADGVAAQASRAINDEHVGLRCVGAVSPGYGNVDELSKDEIIDHVNASNADFLMASLGALKGQLWLHRNRRRLSVPVRAHLGAVMNFQAQTIRRAPVWLRKFGFEWLWRIREEPQLWRRYLDDGLALIRLLATHTLPLVADSLWRQVRSGGKPDLLVLQARAENSATRLALIGAATTHHIERAASLFRELVPTQSEVVIDLSRTQFIDARFFGLILMFRKQLIDRGAQLKFIGAYPGIARIFRLNGVEFLLATVHDVTAHDINVSSVPAIKTD